MCGFSCATLGNEEVSLHIGHSGGKISIGSYEYCTWGKCDKVELKEMLNAYTKQNLISMVLDLVNNGDEG